MVLCVKARRKQAEQIRRKLSASGALEASFVPLREGGYVYFALKKGARLPPGKGFKACEKKLAKRTVCGKSLSEELQGRLTEREFSELVTSFDIVGDIAVLEVPPSLRRREKMIARAAMKVNRCVKVVARKAGATSGKFRIRPVEVIAGENRTETLYREGGCAFELDLNKTYFSSRLGTERERITRLVKNRERVLVPFAGVGPFAIRIGKKVPLAEVVGIEFNPAAIEYFQKNVVRNNTVNTFVVCEDASKILPGNFTDWADRAVMPLPKDALHFLELVIPCLKRGGILHYYSFGDSEKPFEKAEHEVKDAARKLKRRAKVLFRRIVRPYSKSKEQVVIDAKIL